MLLVCIINNKQQTNTFYAMSCFKNLKKTCSFTSSFSVLNSMRMRKQRERKRILVARSFDCMKSWNASSASKITYINIRVPANNTDKEFSNETNVTLSALETLLCLREITKTIVYPDKRAIISSTQEEQSTPNYI